ncbi:MAG: DUF1272 domain-containing protein [Candidatus Binatia bacterium]
MLELRPTCETCNKALPADPLDARICTYAAGSAPRAWITTLLISFRLVHRLHRTLATEFAGKNRQ